MSALLPAFFFTFLFFLTHILCFRLKIMKFQPPFFLLIFLIWLAVLFSFLKSISGTGLFWSPLILYSLLCLAYVAESTAIENESPSMKIIKCILRHSESRATLMELKNEFSDREFIHDRLNDLVKNGHILQEGGLYRLTSRGLLIASVIKAYRNLIRRGLGG